MKKLLTIFLIIFVLTTATNSVFGFSTLISDDFNREDSNTVGNGWTQVAGSSGAPYPTIFSNQLRQGGAAGNVQSGIYRSCGAEAELPISMATDVTIVSNPGTRPFKIFPYYANGAQASSGFTGIFIFIKNGTSNNLEIRNGTTQVALGSFTINLNTKYYLWFDIEDSGSGLVDAKFYISTSSTKPATPTLSAFDITPDNDGSDCAIAVDATQGGEWLTDSVVITSGEAPPVANIFQSIIWLY